MESSSERRWLTVTQDMLLLHDGLERVTDLVALPKKALEATEDDKQELDSFDETSPNELAEKLRAFCSNRSMAFTQLLEYRLNALIALWQAERKRNKNEGEEKRESGGEGATSTSIPTPAEAVPFTSRVSLLLLFPLLESQSEADRRVRSQTVALLANCLSEYEPLALLREPKDCVDGLERLLVAWLRKEREESDSKTEMAEIAAAFVALSCARGSVSACIRAIDLLLECRRDVESLPVGNVLRRLIQLDGVPSEPLCLPSGTHVASWSFDDRLDNDGNAKASAPAGTGNICQRRVACDGTFLYISGSNGSGLVRIGTGLHGTLRGFPYVVNKDLNVGWIAWIDGHLLHRMASSDATDVLCHKLDPSTLTVTKEILLPVGRRFSSGSRTTLSLCGDGKFVHWLYCANKPITSEKTRIIPVYVESYEIKCIGSNVTAEALRNRVMLFQRDEVRGGGGGGGGEMRKATTARAPGHFGVRQRAVFAAAFASSSSSSSPSTGKADSSQDTSCGVNLKTLQKSASFADGTFITIMTFNQGSGGAISRSLFGSSSAQRNLGTCWCFHLSEGHGEARVDVPANADSALGQGAPAEEGGLCYDVVNHCIWSCASDYVDVWLNPGNLSIYHALRAIGMPCDDESLGVALGKEASILSSQAIDALLQHLGVIGANDVIRIALKSPSLTKAKIRRVEPQFVDRIRRILEYGIEEGNHLATQCILIVLPLLISSLSFDEEPIEPESNLYKIREFAWGLAVNEGDHPVYLRKQAAVLLSSALRTFYRSESDLLAMLSDVLHFHGKTPGGYLYDKVLLYLADEKSIQTTKLPDNFVEKLIRFAVEEACTLLKTLGNSSSKEFINTTSSMPTVSSTVRFLVEFQSNVLKQLVLSDQNAVGDKVQAAIACILRPIFIGCREIFDVLLDVCASCTQNKELERFCHGMEKIAKATILGQLLQPAVCCLNDSNLRTLPLADALIGDLVVLTVVASKTAVMLRGKRNEKTTQRQHSLETMTRTGLATPEEIETLRQEAEEAHDSGYLSNLTIPCPWTAGRTIETIHPVRDNYKFKETVTIPGARNLYIKFDPRCASQYDYDKVCVYSGTTTSCRKVAEYGGNTHGFGSKSVLGSGWPKEPVKVEGGSATFTFEMRSGREHNTPDRAVWGFGCTIRAQESLDDSDGTGLPFFADLALGLSVVGCSLLELLYDGPPEAKEERESAGIMSSPLLNRCVWPNDDTSSVDQSTSMISLEKLERLRQSSGQMAPPIRQSIKEVIDSSQIELCLVSACLKHIELDLNDAAAAKEVFSHVFAKVNALLRQLQHIAEVELNWFNDVDDASAGRLQPSDAFFLHYADSGKIADLKLLCEMHGVDANPTDWTATTRHLVDALAKQAAQRESKEKEEKARDASVADTIPRTVRLARGVVERAKLLLAVVLEKSASSPSSKSSIRSKPPDYFRSVSAPSTLDGGAELHRGFQDLLRLKQWQQANSLREKRSTTSLLTSSRDDLVGGGGARESNQERVVDEIFEFIRNQSGDDASTECRSFFKAAEIRRQRGRSRYRALDHMKQLMKVAKEVGGATQLVFYITPTLARGLSSENLNCSGLIGKVRSGFEETMEAVVRLAAQYPIDCLNSIGLLCVIPYTKADERSLIGSGLLQLLDTLCNPKGVTSDKETQRRVTSIAWAGFRVLANRCVSWEQATTTATVAVSESELARQVSHLLSHHLERVSRCGQPEALHEALAYLHSLSQRSNMGRHIVSRPRCIARLLSLLVEHRPTPKLIQVVLQLCRLALPLMSPDDCESIQIPSTARSDGVASSQLSAAAQIISLFVTKLGDFVVPTITDHGAIATTTKKCSLPTGNEIPPAVVAVDETDRASVFIHKRQDQSAHEVIHSLLSSDSRPFRPGGASMEKVMRMDRAMNETGRAEVITDERRFCLRKATHWAQSGFVVSVDRPLDESARTSAVASDKKKKIAEEVCREKNRQMVESVRPFISGQVAISMASEIIALLRGLSSGSEEKTAQFWAGAIYQVLHLALSKIPALATSLSESGTGDDGELLMTAKAAMAALCALGGFKESLRPGCEVEIVADGDGKSSRGYILNISELQGIASVKFDDSVVTHASNNVLDVPLCRLASPSNDALPPISDDVLELVAKAIESLVKAAVPARLIAAETDTTTISEYELTCGRFLAELRTRACILLARHIQNDDFRRVFVASSGGGDDGPLKILSSLADKCSYGERLSVVENQCDKLRMLYRDLARPSPPPAAPKPRTTTKSMALDAARSFPRTRHCLFASDFTEVTYMGDGSPAASGHPRGVLLFATSALASSASSFYWEVELLHLEASAAEDRDVVQVSVGFMPNVDSSSGQSWNNPEGTCLLHSTGKVVVYGASVLDKKMTSLDIELRGGDTIGVGWLRGSDENSSRGAVFFTRNGQRLEKEIAPIRAQLWPVIHVQKKNVRVRANFGSSPFVYGEGNQLATHSDKDSAEEIVRHFALLPFHEADCGGVEAAKSPTDGGEKKTSGKEQRKSAIPTARPSPPIATIGYDAAASSRFKHPPSFDEMISSGPCIRAGAGQPPEPVDDDNGGNGGNGGGGGNGNVTQEDLHGLLVKSWETKVFPVIRRRFRNESERRNGLEQIKGALQLGMADIARQTVEFLYEENGGIPRDLHLPTLDEVKLEAEKFSMDSIGKGKAVVIRALDNSLALPKFAIINMHKTFGLTGTVIDVDKSHDLVQVETYLESEGILVHYWYPVNGLEKPPPGYRKDFKALSPASLDSVVFHRGLLRYESSLAQLYCRSALLVYLKSSLSLLSDGNQLRLLSCHLLSDPQPDGTCVASSINSAPSPRQCLSYGSCFSPSIFYSFRWNELSDALNSAIEKMIAEGHLTALAVELNTVLQTAPKAFRFVDINITEAKEKTDVVLPGAAATVVACQPIKSGSLSSSKGPWARVLVYRGDADGGKHLQAERFEVMRYPNNASSTPSAKSGTTFHGDEFPTLFLPCDRVHVQCGAAPSPKASLRFHAVPPAFPLSLAFVSLLPDWYDRRPRASVEITDALAHCVESLTRVLYRTELAMAIRELVFHLLARALNVIMRQLRDGNFESKSALDVLKTSAAKLFALTSELQQIGEMEIDAKKSSESGKLELKRDRLSTYCQSLFELVTSLHLLRRDYDDAGESTGVAVAVATAVTSPPLCVEKKPSATGAKEKDDVQTKAAKRKRSKKKVIGKKSGRGPSPESKAVSPPTTTATATATATATTSSTERASNYPAWLNNAFKAVDLLQDASSSSSLPSPQLRRDVVKDALVAAAEAASRVTIADRLLVVRGLAETLEAEEIVRVLTRHCNSHGGVYKNEIYLPTVVRACKPRKPVKEETTTAAAAATSGGTAAAAAGNQAESHFSDLQAAFADAQEALGLAVGMNESGPIGRQFMERALGQIIIEGGSESEEEDYNEYAEALAQEMAFDSAVENDELYLPFDVGSLAAAAAAVVPANSSIPPPPDNDDDEDEDDDDDDVVEPSEQPENGAASEGNRRVEEEEEEEVTAAAAPASDFEDEDALEMRVCSRGFAVVQVRCSAQLPAIISELSESVELANTAGEGLRVEGVDSQLMCKDADSHKILERYLTSKLVIDDDEGKLTAVAKETLTSLFKSGASDIENVCIVTRKEAEVRCLLYKLVTTCESTFPDLFSAKTNEPVSLSQFLSWIEKISREKSTLVWKGLIDCGYNFQYERIVSEPDGVDVGNWSLSMDAALVRHVDQTCNSLATSPNQLRPDEVVIDQSDMAKEDLYALQGLSRQEISTRFCFLQKLNERVESDLLPLVDFRVADTHPYSLSWLLAQARDVFFYHTKMMFFNHVLNSSCHRLPDQPPPEVILDPLEVVGSEASNVPSLQFCQAARQLASVPSSKLRVKLAAGGDPTFAFNVRYTGEEVHGTSGSFRHFLSQVAKELQSSLLPILISCPSSAAGRNKGKMILRPGSMSYGEEKLLQFFGQLLGVALRADMPFPLDILPCFWKSLLNLPLNLDEDLKEADILTYKFLKGLEEVKSEAEFANLGSSTENYGDELTATSQLQFVYPSVSGDEVELCVDGQSRSVTWENRLEFVELVKKLRIDELVSERRFDAIRSGLACIVPVRLLNILTHRDLERRTAGLPEINLAYLKAHTMYQVGLMESDRHIQFFWRVLESFSQDELRRFVKFACNQERIPMGQPSRSTADIHVPPYPMKIAPPDGQGVPDSRFVRAETCMFMIKLPQYSSEKVMAERLRYAINCREDPLSG